MSHTRPKKSSNRTLAIPPKVVARSKLKHTKVFDTYWRLAAERQEIFFRRLGGESAVWTSDPILQRHRFTNAYRASDRVSQYLIRNVQYGGEQEAKELFFRTILFKLFNRIDTWELLEQKLGGIHASEFSVKRYERVLDRAQELDQRIYSAAYIMPTADRRRGCSKHSGHLLLLERMLRDNVPERVAEARSLRHAFGILRTYPMMGEFLAFQYTIDLNYSQLLGFSEMDFVVPGPGARRGIRKCFGDLGEWGEAEVIRYVTERQEYEFTQRGICFRDLWGRPLQLIDCQNLFCEVDKYARVAFPELNCTDRRTRIKQLFRSGSELAAPWYPPKWKLNDRVEHSMERVRAPYRG